MKVVAAEQAADLGYWHDSPEGKARYWSKDPPTTKDLHLPHIVYETSTLYLSDDIEVDRHASVGPDYKPKGCGDVYVTGGALFPSLSATLTLCGYTQDLAKIGPRPRAWVFRLCTRLVFKVFFMFR
jgi:hypothetical protein